MVKMLFPISSCPILYGVFSRSKICTEGQGLYRPYLTADSYKRVRFVSIYLTNHWITGFSFFDNDDKKTMGYMWSLFDKYGKLFWTIGETCNLWSRRQAGLDKIKSSLMRFLKCTHVSNLFTPTFSLGLQTFGNELTRHNKFNMKKQSPDSVLPP